MKTGTLIATLSGVLLASAGMLPAAPPQPPKPRNAIFIMSGGLRWQDVFHGADPDLLDKDRGGIEESAAFKREFWRETPAARREALMPFLWTVIARRGQIYGNRDRA